MAYLTLDDLLNRFDDLEQAADRDGDGEADSAVMTSAIHDASGEIDGYLRGRYALPILGAVPDDLVSFACDITRYRLYGNAATDQVTRRYQRAVGWLKEIAQGTVTLPLAPLSAAQEGRLAACAPARVYTNTRLAGY